MLKVLHFCEGNNKQNGHVCLIGINAPLRTDESFRNQEDENHHHDESPLEELPIDMVHDIPLEYLHLILYGGMKRLLMSWVQGTKRFKFSERDLKEISAKHQEAGLTKPSEIELFELLEGNRVSHISSENGAGRFA